MLIASRRIGLFGFCCQSERMCRFTAQQAVKPILPVCRQKKRRVLLDSLDLRAYTEHTHTSTETLEDELQRISKDGFALDLEEFHDGMVAIAVPVLDSRRRYVAALAIHGPKQRFDFDEAMARRGLLAESAKIISQTFGH